MKKLILYEFRNMWTQLTVVAVLSLVLLSTALNFIAFLSSDVAFTETGGEVRGAASYRAVKNEMGKSGRVMDQEYLDALARNYNSSVEKRLLQGKIGYYLTKYTYSNYIINFAEHGLDFTNVDMDLDEPLDATAFYKQYKDAALEVTVSNNRNNWVPYTQRDIEKLAERIRDVQTPFRVDYYSGLSLLSWQFGNQFWIVLVVAVFAVSGLFAKDSANGIGEITLSSRFGRKKDMNARILAGNMFAVALYLLFLLTLLAEIGSVSSLRGFGQSIQNLWYTCTFNITVGGGILILFAHGLLTVLVIANLAMLIAMLLKRSKRSIFASVALVFLFCSPLFSNNSLWGQLNPISIATNFASGIPNAFEIYYFVGDAVIPYALAFPGLALFYLGAIRVASLAWGYRKYKIG